MIETGVLVGWLVVWAVGKAKRAGRTLDGALDDLIDARMHQVHDAIVRKLGPDPALKRLDVEAASGQVQERTRQRVELAVRDAIADDADFAVELQQLAAAVQAARGAAGATATGDGAGAVGGDVSISADHGSVAGWQVGPVTLPSPVTPTAYVPREVDPGVDPR